MKTRQMLLFSAVLYGLGVALGWLVAGQPTYVAPIAPASGVALAVLLLWGRWLWPAVWIIAFALIGWLDVSAEGLSLAVIIASVTTAQALLGASVARRFLASSTRQVYDWTLARVLFNVGPLVSLLGASLGAASLLAMRRVGFDQAPSVWLTWWTGDVIGVLLVAPLLLLVLARRTDRPAWVDRATAVRMGVLLCSALLTLAAGRVGVDQLDENRRHIAAQRLMDEVFDVGFLPLPAAIDALRGVERFLSASTEVTREEFTAYTGWLFSNPAFTSIDWAPKVTHADRAAFEATLQAQGFHDYRIFEPGSDNLLRRTGERETYYPVLFSEPRASGRAVLGLDHGSFPYRHAEMVHAAMSGVAHLTRLAPLIRTERRSILVFQPVYHQSIQAQAREGNAAGSALPRDLRGFVVGIIDARALFDPLINAARARGINIRVSDVTENEPREILVDNLVVGKAPDLSKDLTVGGRTLRLEMQPSETNGVGLPLVVRPDTAIYQLFAAMAALLVAYVALSTAGHTAAIAREVTERTAELKQELEARREAEDQLDRFFELSLNLLGIAGVDGYFRRINSAFGRTLGWSDAEFLSRPFLDFVHPEDLQNTISEVAKIASGEPTLGFENRYRCKDGSWRWLEWTAQPQPGGLMFVIASDSTERRASARRLQQLNADLERRVGEREEALNALGEKKEEIRAILDHLLESVVTIDEHGIVQQANPAIKSVFGYKPEEVVGKNVSMLMPSPHREAHDNYLIRYLATGERRVIGMSREVEGQHKDGHLIQMELSVAEYRLRSKRMFIGTLRDISERRALITQLTQASMDAEQASQAKSAFLAMMSHEIRTPMNGVIGMVDVLGRTRLNDHQNDLLATIRDSSTTLLSLIDDILDFSKIEAGKLELEPVPVSLVDIVEGLVVSLLSVAAKRDVDLAVFVSPQIPERVIGDEVRLRQILYNLVGNAIKFSAGRPGVRGQVSIRAALDEGVTSLVKISVSDNGIGIPKDRVDELFNPFVQAESSTTRRFGGTGLGLAICKRLVTLMGGSISVDTEAGQGATFIVRLPMYMPSEQPHRPWLRLDGVSCVLLDSDQFHMDDVRAYLEAAGARIKVVQEAKDVASAIHALPPPTVLVEYASETGGRGIDLSAASGTVRRVRVARGRRRRPRITGPDTVTLDSNALRRQALLRAVAVAAGQASPEIFQGPGDDASQHQEVVPPTVGEARSQGRLILVAEDDEVNQKVILQQLGLLGYAAEVATNGAEALEMWRKGGYALLLTDLHMPELDGYQLADAIRREESLGARRPIVALTANALQGEARRAYEVGMDEYLTKPVRLDLLGATLGKWLPGIAAPDAPEPAAVESHGSAKLFDIGVLTGLVGNAPEVLREFLVDYLDVAEQLFSEVKSAAADGDLREVSACMHKLKSSSRSVGAIPLGDACAGIENACRAGNSADVAGALEKFITLYSSTMERIAQALRDGVTERIGEVDEDSSG